MLKSFLFCIFQIGVVGNSGSGKTSLSTVLLRLVEPNAGEILIDKICVQDLGMHQLRERISVITEDPVLFPGSLRTNLDPFGRSPDISVWDALSMVMKPRSWSPAVEID